MIAPGNATSPIHQQLEVFSVLHRIGADLGEPIEIRQSGSQLLVIGTGLTAVRKEQLKAALAEIPEVAVRFDEATANQRSSSTPSDRAAAATAPMQTRLEALLGGRESAEEFTNRALDASDAVMSRVHALRALARAFPLSVQSSLVADDGNLLKALRGDHAAALEQRIADLQRILKPLVTQPPPSPVAQPASTWQSAAEALFAAAQQLDDSLNAALAGPGATGDDGFGKLGVAAARLQSQFAVYQKASQ
jgi:hypothetical protein